MIPISILLSASCQGRQNDAAPMPNQEPRDKKEVTTTDPKDIRSYSIDALIIRYFYTNTQ